MKPRPSSLVTPLLAHAMKQAKLPTIEVIQTFNTLSNLGKLPAGLTSLKIARIIASVKNHAKRIEKERNALVERFRLESGAIDPARNADWRLEERALMGGDTWIQAPFLTQEELEKLHESTSFDPAMVAYLLPFVEGEEKET